MEIKEKSPKGESAKREISERRITERKSPKENHRRRISERNHRERANLSRFDHFYLLHRLGVQVVVRCAPSTGESLLHFKLDKVYVLLPDNLYAFPDNLYRMTH